MERVGADDHPLSTNSYFRSSYSDPGAGAPSSSNININSNNTNNNIRSPTASLIQSAARSVLDDATPSTVVSDDASESFSYADGTTGRSNRHPLSSSPTLSSLQIHTAPAIPCEQDRRRFIGCLAAVLASAYDFDEPDELAMTGDLPAASAYSSVTEELYEDETEEASSHLLQSSSSVSDYNNNNSGSNNNPLHAAASFESDAYSAAESAYSQGGKSAVSNSASVSATTRHHQRRSMGSKERARFSRQRHRRRRYDILCRLLVTSAELLLLDKAVARAFLPMLEQLLVPQPKPQQAKNDNPSNQRPPLYGTSASARTHNTDKSVRSKLNEYSSEPEPITIVTEEDGGASSPEPAKEYVPEEVDKEDLLRPFLESLTPGAGFRCLSLLLLQHLLTSEAGYDARIRHVLKKVGVIVLLHDIERDPVEHEMLPPKRKHEARSYKDMASHAARKWESLEHSIARRLIRLSESNASVDKKKNSNGHQQREISVQENEKNTGITREQLVRGVKIGSAGLVAGTLFAFTGGLAAPGIAAGVAAFAGAAAGTAAVVTLTSTAVVTTIFGVGGGSLAAYKMQRRTQGLTEFEFQKETDASTGNETSGSNGSRPASSKANIEAELFSTICISGWLRDEYDFQRPWGLHPTSPRLDDRLELLERFYSIHSPDHLPKCRRILESWRGEEDQLWEVLRAKYGVDPDHLFPLKYGQRVKGALTLEQEEALDQIFVELGYNSQSPDRCNPAQRQPTPFERMKKGWNDLKHKEGKEITAQPALSLPSYGIFASHSHNSNSTSRLADWRQNSMMDTGSSSKEDKEGENDKVYDAPQHLATVWDYKSSYGGELYTIRWESDLIKKICDCVMDMAMDVVSGATKHILRQTILSTLLAAVVWPSYLLNVANMIDGDWTLAVERAEQAGKELAKTLLFSRAGHRPVTLVGFSFGARVIYCCLKELARLQDDWEDFQELLREDLENQCSDEKRLQKLSKRFEGMREPASVVEDAILMGLPNHLSLLSWKGCRQVVGGRLVNCFSTKDLILSLMFQAKRFSGGSLNNGVSGFFLKPVCGTCPVPEPGIENIDVSDLVSGHQDYCLVTGKILERVHHGQPLRYTAAPVDNLSRGKPNHAKKLVY